MPNLPKNYIFLPLQVHDDTQILIHSPQIKKMEDFIRKVYTAIEKVNERENKNYYLVLKEHPRISVELLMMISIKNTKEKIRGNKAGKYSSDT